MITLLDLYNLRRDIAENRQKDHFPLYEELHEFLTSLKKDQPYDLGFEIKKEFEALGFYVDEAFGRPAHITNRDDFLYRICSIVDIVNGTEWLKDEETDVANWDQVYKKSNGGWMPLSKVASGIYKCQPRHFSWWTTLPLSRQDVIPSAHRIGMTNDWVATQCVILRCPVKHVNEYNLAYVPSVIDAFMQMIFHPTRDATSPPHGITIDLSMYPLTLCPGTDEIVLSKVRVDKIEVLPVNMEKDDRKGQLKVLSDCPTFRDMLKNYYENLRLGVIAHVGT